MWKLQGKSLFGVREPKTVPQRRQTNYTLASQRKGSGTYVTQKFSHYQRQLFRQCFITQMGE